MTTLLRITAFALFIGLALTLPVAAQTDVAVTVEPSSLAVIAVKDRSLASATFYVTASQGVSAVTFDASDLDSITGLPTDQPTLFPTQIMFSPATLQSPPAGQRQRVQVTINNITQAGVWAGSVSVQWTGEMTGTLTVPLTVTMQTAPNLVIESPPMIVVRGLRGASSSTRRVTLHETGGGSPVTGLSLFPRDLLNDDQSVIFPKSAISATLAATSASSQDLGNQISGGGRADVIVGLNLVNAPSGSFQGNLIVQSDNASDVLIPIKVEVKDPPLWPLIWMVGGVMAGVGLTWYRSSVMPKDKLRVRIQVLREHQNADAEFKQHCGPQKVDVEIGLAEDNLREDRVAEAGAALARAEAVWDNWRRFRNSLLESIQAMGKLAEAIEQGEEDFKQWPPILALRTQITNLLSREIPDYTARPLDLRDKVLNPNTGWQAVLDTALTLHRNLSALRSRLEVANKQGGLALDAGDVTMLTTHLNQIAERFRAITTVPTVEALIPLLTDAHTLYKDLDKAGEEGAAVKASYEACRSQAESWLNQIDSAEPHITEAVKVVRKAGVEAPLGHARELRWKMAFLIAQNGLRAAQACGFLQRSADEYRAGQTDDKWAAVLQAERALASWLTTDTRYAEPSQGFFDKLAELASGLKTAAEAVSGKTFSLNWGELPRGAARGMDEAFSIAARPLADMVGVDVGYISRGEGRALPRQWPWDAAWWTPGRRLWAANLVTFVVGVGLMAFVGFKELYTDVNTYGVGGAWDYFKLFVWGFGAEAGRAQVLGLVKEWGIISPRQG